MPQKHRRFVRSVQAAVSRVRHPGAEEIKQNRPKNRRKTKCSAQDLAVGRKSCPFPAGYRPKMSARCAEFVPGLVRQIDFRLSARLNRAMTGESLQQTDTNFESEENTMKKILALLLAVAMIAAFCACAQQSADTAPAAPRIPPPRPPPTPLLRLPPTPRLRLPPTPRLRLPPLPTARSSRSASSTTTPTSPATAPPTTRT